jgi:hypothetical protein
MPLSASAFWVRQVLELPAPVGRARRHALVVGVAAELRREVADAARGLGVLDAFLDGLARAAEGASRRRVGLGLGQRRLPGPLGVRDRPLLDVVDIRVHVVFDVAGLDVATLLQRDDVVAELVVQRLIDAGVLPHPVERVGRHVRELGHHRARIGLVGLLVLGEPGLVVLAGVVLVPVGVLELAVLVRDAMRRRRAHALGLAGTSAAHGGLLFHDAQRPPGLPTRQRPRSVISMIELCLTVFVSLRGTSGSSV